MDAKGRILVAQPEPTEPPAQIINGSPIEATVQKVSDMTSEQATAIQTLGGKLSGGKKRYHRGGADVEVQNVPNLVSAGSVDATAGYADLLKLQAQAKTDASYDGLGTAPAMKVGGKRKSRKNKKNGRKKHSSIRSNRRTVRRTRRVRNSHRGIRIF
jgi:hypothetical protein